MRAKTVRATRERDMDRETLHLRTSAGRAGFYSVERHTPLRAWSEGLQKRVRAKQGVRGTGARACMCARAPWAEGPPRGWGWGRASALPCYLYTPSEKKFLGFSTWGSRAGIGTTGPLCRCPGKILSGYIEPLAPRSNYSVKSNR
jgi:hypothetical protein